jgi:hypothetical protein
MTDNTTTATGKYYTTLLEVKLLELIRNVASSEPNMRVFPVLSIQFGLNIELTPPVLSV